MKINNFNKFLIIFFLLLFSLMPIVYSLDNLETGHYIQQNTPTNVNYANGLCSRITSPSKLFIPNKTVEEFQSFLNKASALGVSFSGCCDEACLDPFDYNVARCGDSLLTGCGDENNCGISLACPVSTEECNGADCCNANCDDYPASEVSCGKPILNGCYSACGGVGTKNDCGNDQYCGISGDCVACPVCSSPSQVNCGTPFYTPYISGCTTKSCGYGINSMQCSSGYCAEDGSHCCSVCPDSGSYNCGTPIPSNNCDQSCGYGTDASSCPVEQFCDTSNTIPECKPIPTPDCDEGFPFASEVSCGVPIKNDCGFDTDPPTCGLKDDCGSGQYCNGCNGCKTCTVKLPSEINCGDSYTNECGVVYEGTKDNCDGASFCLDGECCDTSCPNSNLYNCGASIPNNDCGGSCGTGTKKYCTNNGDYCPGDSYDDGCGNTCYGNKICDVGEECSNGICYDPCDGTYVQVCQEDPSDVPCGVTIYDQCGKPCGEGEKKDCNDGDNYCVGTTYYNCGTCPGTKQPSCPWDDDYCYGTDYYGICTWCVGNQQPLCSDSDDHCQGVHYKTETCGPCYGTDEGDCNNDWGHCLGDSYTGTCGKPCTGSKTCGSNQQCYDGTCYTVS